MGSYSNVPLLVWCYKISLLTFKWLCTVTCIQTYSCGNLSSWELCWCNNSYMLSRILMINTCYSINIIVVPSVLQMRHESTSKVTISCIQIVIDECKLWYPTELELVFPHTDKQENSKHQNHWIRYNNNYYYILTITKRYTCMHFDLR